MEELETEEIEYKTVEEFLTALKKKFGGGEKESVKAAELRKLEQGGRMMEGVERMNVVVVRGAGVSPKWDPYAMEVDQERNCYACGGFGHMARHCRNRGRGRVMEERSVEYRGGRIEEIYDHINNLKEIENLELLD